MAHTITPNQIKQTNRRLIYQYIRSHPMASQQDISYALNLSRPTVTTKLTEMETSGLIEKSGQIMNDVVGRKPSGYSIVADYRIAVGVEIREKELRIVIVDLYGTYARHTICPLPFANTERYGKQAAEKITAFIDALDLKPEQILGIGIAVPGLVSPDGSVVTYGKILDCTGLPVERFSAHLPYPCRLFHDSSSAAYSELWASPELQDFFYMSLSIHLGAAMIKDRQMIAGKHGHSATVEHIVMIPKGNKCYCGQSGCIETVCSLSALLHKNESEESFFKALREGKASAKERWTVYLGHLAGAIDRIHLMYDTDFVLGGYLAPYLTEEDILRLHELIRARTPFEEDADFLHISKQPKHNIVIGAALPYVRAFLHSDDME